jgi:O-antigen ligase
MLTCLPQKKNTLFWLVVFFASSYYIAIFIFKPYKIHISYFAFFSISLLLFIWTMFIKWDTKKIITIVTALGIYLLLTGFGEWLFIDSVQIKGPLTVATCYAVTLVLIWAIWFVESYLNKRFSYFVMFLGTLLVFFAVVLSGTRMGVIGIVMGLLLGVVFNAWASRLKDNTLLQKIFYSIFVLACMSLLIFTIWTLVPNEVYVKQKMENVIEGKIDVSNMGRIVSWAVALKAIQEHKIWGIGPGNFTAAYKSFVQSLPNINAPKSLKRSHNLYLMILSEFGLVGFFAFGIVVVACFKQLFSSLKSSNSTGIHYALLSCGIITMVLGMVDIIPFDWYSMCLVAWYMGMLASFRA